MITRGNRRLRDRHASPRAGCKIPNSKEEQELGKVQIFDLTVGRAAVDGPVFYGRLYQGWGDRP